MAYTGIISRNKVEKQAIQVITKCFNFLENELHTNSKLEFGRTALWGKDAYHAGIFLHREKQVVLNFRNLYGFDFDTLLQVLGHEMRHAYQMSQGWFNEPIDKLSFQTYRQQSLFGYKNGWYKGQYYNRVAYQDQPWEVDAEKYEMIYRDMCVDAGIITEEELNMVLPGDKTKRPLEKLTKDNLRKQYGNIVFCIAYTESKFDYDNRVTAIRTETDNKIKALGFKLVGNKWTYVGKKQDSMKAHRAIGKMTINPNPRRKENKNGICWLDAKIANDLDDRDEIIEMAQNNFVPYETRLLTIKDLTC